MPQIQPSVGDDVFIAPSAYVSGDVSLGDECTVMHHAVIRGDIAPIRLGNRVNVQDGTIIHTQYEVPLDIADNVAIGHRAVVHCRSVGSWTLIGTGSIVLDGSRVGEHCLIAAGTVVLPGTIIDDGKLVAGVPGKVRRNLEQRDRDEIARIVNGYVQIGARHRRGDFPNIAPQTPE